jgi:hypothetical protein
LYFLNIPLGVGVDLAFGKSDIRLGLDSDISLQGSFNHESGATVYQDKPGSFSVTAGGDMSPKFFQPKLMTGLGFTLGPVVIDIPVTWYFLDHGASVGVTLGVVW